MTVNGELGKTWKEAAMTYFYVLYLYMPGGTEKNHVKTYETRPASEI